MLREFSGCAPSKPLHPLASFASGETQFLHSPSHGRNQCEPDDVIKARLENQRNYMYYAMKVLNKSTLKKKDYFSYVKLER